MTTLILLFNGPATEKLGVNTRMRVKAIKRGGLEFVALRPSYRVSGKNAMIRTEKNTDGSFTAVFPESLFKELSLPNLKSENSQYLMEDIGYGWFLMKESAEFDELTDAIINVSKLNASDAASYTNPTPATDGGTAGVLEETSEPVVEPPLVEERTSKNE